MKIRYVITIEAETEPGNYPPDSTDADILNTETENVNKFPGLILELGLNSDSFVAKAEAVD